MSQEKQVMRSIPSLVSSELGDFAVDGLLAGVQAGLVMAVIMAIGGWLNGTNLQAILRSFAAGQNSLSPLAGLLVHLAVSGVYGVIFSLGLSLLPRRISRHFKDWSYLAIGSVYGLVLSLLAVWVILPNTGSALAEVALPVLITAHVAYGLSLAGLLYRQLRDRS